MGGVKERVEPAKTDAFARYMASCNDYLKRQIIVYQNWPQRKFSVTGYTEEKVFTDQNA